MSGLIYSILHVHRIRDTYTGTLEAYTLYQHGHDRDTAYVYNAWRAVWHPQYMQDTACTAPHGG